MHSAPFNHSCRCQYQQLTQLLGAVRVAAAKPQNKGLVGLYDGSNGPQE